MKVNEAKEKICPFMSDNTTGKEEDGSYSCVSYCIGNDCMAWINKSDYKEIKTLYINDEYNLNWKNTYELDNKPRVVISVKPLNFKVAVKTGIKLDGEHGYCIRLKDK